MQFDFSSFDWSDDDSSPFDQCDSSNSGCGEPLSMSSSSSSTRTPTVRFAQEDEIFDHLHINDFTEDDINATWFRPDEFRQMRSQIQQSVSEIEEQDGQGVDTDTLTMRGLEFRTIEGGMKRSFHKREAYAAVLEEQTRQRRYGLENLERIAAAYQIVSYKCLGMALLRAVQDEQDARESSVSSPSSTTESTSPVKPYEAELNSRRLAVLEDIKILSGASEIELWHANPAAA